MQQQIIIEDAGLAPSFSCYYTDSITSRAVAKAIHEEEVARFHENGDVEGQDFEFVLALSDIEGSVKERASRGSPCDTKCKKSSSPTGSSKRWIFWYMFARKKVDRPKQKGNSAKVSNVSGMWTAHEQFYVQKRAENEVGKRRSYLPYKKDLVGLFANVNGMRKMLTF